MSEDEKDDKSDKPLFVVRFVAYIIDAFIVLFVSTLIATPFTNPDNLINLSKNSSELIEKYNHDEITEQQYLVDASNLQYKMAQEMELFTIISILISVLYYVVFPLFNNGQTIGKKLMKLKIVSTLGDLNSNQLIFRSFMANFVLLNIISVLFVMLAPRDIYYNCVELFTFAQYTITFASVIMVLFGKEGIALHDGVVHTKVIKVK